MKDIIPNSPFQSSRELLVIVTDILRMFVILFNKKTVGKS